MPYPKYPEVPYKSCDIGRFRAWNDQSHGFPYTGSFAAVLYEFNGTELLNQNHRPSRDGKYREGGSWHIVKTTNHVSPTPSVKVFREGWGPAYEGSFIPTVATGSGSPWWFGYLDVQQSNFLALKNQGAAAWNKLRPDLPDFTVATSILELKDLPGMLKSAVQDVRRNMQQHRANYRSTMSNAGQYYLALQFGWLSLIRDIQNFLNALKSKDDRLRQLIRDEGKPVRRRVSMQDNREVTLHSSSVDTFGSGSTMYPLLVTQCYGRGTTQELERVSHSKTWCEGSFSYMLPPGPRDLKWRKKMMRRIMGSRITPDVAYELIPWSWLADYFTDLGQFVKAVSSGVADRCYANYAYIMKTESFVGTYSTTMKVRTNLDATSITEVQSSNRQEQVSKMRVPASPFGFGFKQSDLSVRQAAILGALGLSRLP